ncbi:MAG: exlusion protein FxsA [Rhodobacteraceae bacterium PARR1]|nr:MAG: exlusion protein FxsA [Rhodobacteraceae bacterium PARR1]
MRLFTLFLLWPLAEIILFVTVGGAIGLLWTLAVIAGSAVLGVWLLRSRGVRSAAEMRRGLTVVRGGGLGQLAGDVLVMLAGVLLILPGFLTDALGLMLLLPPVRALIILWAARRVGDGLRARATPSASGRFGDGRPDIIDAEFIEVDHDTRPDSARPPSGWTRH